jgi:hypothetical protein
MIARFKLHLVADQEQVSPPATLFQAIDGRLAGHEVHRQFVGLGLLTATTALQPEFGEVFVNLDARLELADLQRGTVASGVADAADKDLRMGQVAFF